MFGNVHDLDALDELIAALEGADCGNRALNIRVEYCLCVALGGRMDIAGTLIEGGISCDTVSETLDSRVPDYTTSLDAAVEGENIEFAVKSNKRKQWGALHRSQHRLEIFAWAATEPLARRLAALKGRHADLLLERERNRAREVDADGEQAAEPARRFTDAFIEDDSETENPDWKVLF